MLVLTHERLQGLTDVGRGKDANETLGNGAEYKGNIYWQVWLAHRLKYAEQRLS